MCLFLFSKSCTSEDVGSLWKPVTEIDQITNRFRVFGSLSYKSVVDSLSDLLSRPMIPTLCEQWRDHIGKEGNLCDVYDGKMWERLFYE